MNVNMVNVRVNRVAEYTIWKAHIVEEGTGREEVPGPSGASGESGLGLKKQELPWILMRKGGWDICQSQSGIFGKRGWMGVQDDMQIA